MPGVRELRSHCRRSGQPLRGKFFPDERKVLPTKEAKHPVRSGVVEDVVRNAREPSSLGLSYATLELGVPLPFVAINASNSLVRAPTSTKVSRSCPRDSIS